MHPALAIFFSFSALEIRSPIRVDIWCYSSIVEWLDSHVRNTISIDLNCFELFPDVPEPTRKSKFANRLPSDEKFRDIGDDKIFQICDIRSPWGEIDPMCVRTSLLFRTQSTLAEELDLIRSSTSMLTSIYGWHGMNNRQEEPHRRIDVPRLDDERWRVMRPSARCGMIQQNMRYCSSMGANIMSLLQPVHWSGRSWWARTGRTAIHHSSWVLRWLLTDETAWAISTRELPEGGVMLNEQCSDN